MRKSLFALGFVAAFAAPALAQVSPRVADQDQSYSDTYGVDTTTTQSVTPDDDRFIAPLAGSNAENSKQRGDQSTTFGANGR